VGGSSKEKKRRSQSTELELQFGIKSRGNAGRTEKMNADRGGKKTRCVEKKNSRKVHGRVGRKTKITNARAVGKVNAKGGEGRGNGGKGWFMGEKAKGEGETQGLREGFR